MNHHFNQNERNMNQRMNRHKNYGGLRPHHGQHQQNMGGMHPGMQQMNNMGGGMP